MVWQRLSSSHQRMATLCSAPVAGNSPLFMRL
jgi:hypothetical protein